jgi:sugar phosphate isomerase/epimerase
MRRVIELAGDLGVPAVVVGPGKANPLLPAPRDELIGYLYAALDVLEPLANKLGTSLLIENMPFSFLPDVKSILTALDNYGNKRIGMVYDVANGHFIKEDINNALRLCKHVLKVVHLSDTTQSIYKHDAIGLGNVDFSSIPATLKEIGFNKKSVLEIITPDPQCFMEVSAKKLKDMGW